MPINRPKAETESRLVSPEGRVQEYPISFLGSNVAGGMNTFLDSANLDPSMFSSLQNVFIRTGRLSRRTGSNILTPAKPDSDAVMRFYSTKLYNGDNVQLRFTDANIYSRSTLAWTIFTTTGGAPSPIGTTSDAWRIGTIDNRIFVTNNGVNPLYELDPINNLIMEAGDAPSFKYIATIANRVIGANLTAPFGGIGQNPNLVCWSGDTNFTEWDVTVDVSAGFDPLLDTIQSHSDFITGLLGFETVLLVMRQESIVLGSLLQSATNPFYFYIAVPNIGCDSPNTLVNISNGCIWYDHKSRMVYRYLIGAQAPEPIGLPVAETIANMIQDPTVVFSSWDQLRQEFQLCIPLDGLTTIWTFNQRTNAWWFDVIPNVTSIESEQYATAAVTIGDLVGTIGSQVGTIGQFSSGFDAQSRFYGLNNGDILLADPSQSLDGGQTYTTVIQSKDFENNEIDAYWKRLKLQLIVSVTTNLGIYYSKDNGNTWTLFKQVTLNPSKNRQLIACNKNIKSRQFMWQVISNSGQFDIVKYEVFGTQGAPARGSSTQT